MAYGTMTLADLQQTLNASTVAQVGEDVTFEAIRGTLAAHNAIMREIYSDFVVPTTEESARTGGPDTMTMEDLDETGVPRAQKITAGQTVGFPLNAVGAAFQWTEMSYRKKTVQEVVAQVDAMMDADRNRLIRDMKRALYLSANYTHTDHLARGVDLAVKRLVNADSQALPPGPNGETFTASTHTHYLARAGGSWAATDLDALINTIREHYSSGELQVFINQADEAAVRAFTGFVAYIDPRVMPATTTVNAIGRSLDVVNYYNRAIGLYNGAEIIVKPWGVASYPFAWNAQAGKPLAWRWDPDYGQDLQVIIDNAASYPFYPKAYRRIFGVGVRYRVNGAVQYTGGTSFVDPTIS